MEHRKEIILNLVSSLSEIFSSYGDNVSNAKLNIWGIALSELSNEQIEFGLKKIISEREEQAMPTPAEFIRYATTQAGVSSYEEEAEIAWNELETAIRKFGHSDSVCFSFPATAEFVRNNQGWTAICLWEEEELTWKRKEFISQYATLRKSGKSFNPVVNGLIDSQNQKYIAKGEALPQISYCKPTPETTKQHIEQLCIENAAGRIRSFQAVNLLLETTQKPAAKEKGFEGFKEIMGRYMNQKKSDLMDRVQTQQAKVLHSVT